jgi:hypothetical protein
LLLRVASAVLDTHLSRARRADATRRSIERRRFSKYFSSLDFKRISLFFLRLLGRFIWDLLQALLIAYILAHII